MPEPHQHTFTVSAENAARFKIGQELELGIIRGGTAMTVKAKTAEAPKESGSEIPGR